MDQRLIQLKSFAQKEYAITPEEVRQLIKVITDFTREHLITAGFDKKKQVQPILTKFRDAGRRSPPWKPTSSILPGRPQDGADGNRRNRWLFETSHKFYADEIMATLVEVRYYLQTLSMLNAPPLPENSIQNEFIWLTGHAIIPGGYLDPIQLAPIDFNEFISNPTILQSGHFIPLDRGGRHIPDNTFLLLSRSNQLQGNQTFDELMQLMAEILKRQKAIGRLKLPTP